MYKRKRVESLPSPSTPSKKLISKFGQFTSQTKDFISSINKPQSHVEKAQAEIKKGVLSNEEAHTYRIAEKQLATMSHWKTASHGLPHHPKKELGKKTLPAWLGADGFEELTEQYLANTSQDQEKRKEFLKYEKKVLDELPPDYKAIFPMKYESSDDEADDGFPQSGQRFYTESDLLKFLRLRGISGKQGTASAILFTNLRTKHNNLQSKQRSLGQRYSMDDIMDECIEHNLNEKNEYYESEVEPIAREVKRNKIVQGMKIFQVKLAGDHLKKAIHLYFNNRNDESQDEMVFSALEVVQKFAGGKTPMLTNKDQPLVDMRNLEGFGDLVVWQARCYCWDSHQTDVDVGDDVLKLIAQVFAILEDREEDEDGETSGDDSSDEDSDESTDAMQATPEEDIDSSFTLEEATSNDDFKDTAQCPEFEEIKAVQSESPSDRLTNRQSFKSSPPGLPGIETLLPRERMNGGCVSENSATMEDDEELSSNFSEYGSLEANSEEELDELFAAEEGLAREAGQRLQ